MKYIFLHLREKLIQLYLRYYIWRMIRSIRKNWNGHEMESWIVVSGRTN
jgi:hypothetical protein